MDNKTGLVLASLLLLSALGSASTVTRSLSTANVAPGGDLAVTLNVEPSAGETYYAIDETVPPGWAIKDPGTGSTDQAQHLKWLVPENAEKTSYTYVLTAPETRESAAFNGFYMFEGMPNEAQIEGANQAAVSTGLIQGPSNDNEPMQEISWLILIATAIIAVLTATFLILRKKPTDHGRSD